MAGDARPGGDVAPAAKADSVFVKIFNLSASDAEEDGVAEISEMPIMSLKFERYQEMTSDLALL